MSQNWSQAGPSTRDEIDDYPRINLDLNVRDKNLTPEKIATLFIEIAQRAEKCYEFEISEWLERYEALRTHPNFAEAALLIVSASQIYARKIDYLEGMVLQMVGDKKKEVDDGDQTKMVRRKTKKFRPNTINDNFTEVEFIVKEVTTLPKSKLTEIVQKKRTDFGSHWEKFKASQCKFVKSKKNRLVVSKRMTENSELIALNSTFGKTHIMDYDQEEVVGTKSDFRCFSNIIDDTFGLVPDYNFRQYFAHVDAVDRDEEKRQRLMALGVPPGEPRDLGPRKFQFYLPKEYMKTAYNIDIESNEKKFKQNALNACIQPSLLLEEYSEFSDMPAAKEAALSPNTEKPKEVTEIDSGFQSFTSDEALNDSGIDSEPQEMPPKRDTDDDDEFFDAIADLHDSGIDLDQSFNTSRETLKSHDHMSVDEGISVCCSLQSPCLSEYDGPTSPHFYLGESFNVMNLFEIDEIYLHHEENFQLPVELVHKQAELVLNLFKFPEQKLRRKLLFSLPHDDFTLRPKNVPKPVEEKTPRIFKVPERCATPPFQGFTDAEIAQDFEITVQEKPQSTPEKRASEEVAENDPKRRSFDSEIMTDDDEPEKPVTPEKIRQSPRMSRDSGIKSPSPPPAETPDETLTVLVEEPEPEPEPAESVASFETADNGLPPAVEFSFHDQEIVAQAQQKYQDQVTEMQSLVEKVNRWHQHLKPILKDSQERGHFEIHEYGSQVLDSFAPYAEMGQTSTFSDVMEGKPRDSIARYFLSTLMLVNSGNVEMTVLKTDPGCVTDPKDIHLRLMSRARLHEAIENMDETVPCIKTKRKSNGNQTMTTPKRAKFS